MTLLTEEQIEALRKELEDTPPELQQEKAKEILSRLTPQQVVQLRGEDKSQCPYCLIGEGKLQSATVYEDDKFKAVLEINPANKGHTVLFPKKHFPYTSNLSRLDHEELFSIVQKIELVLHKLFPATNIYVSNGMLAGQKFDHAVVHIIPREENDEIKFIWQPKKVSKEELDDFLKTIKENFPEEKEVKIEKIDIENIFSKLPSSRGRRP